MCRILPYLPVAMLSTDIAGREEYPRPSGGPGSFDQPLRSFQGIYYRLKPFNSLFPRIPLIMSEIFSALQVVLYPSRSEIRSQPTGQVAWQREVLSSSDRWTFCAIRDQHFNEENYQTPTKSLLFGTSQDTVAFLLQSHILQNAYDGDSRTTDIGLVLILTKLYGFLPPVPCRSIYWIRNCIHTLQSRVRLGDACGS